MYGIYDECYNRKDNIMKIEKAVIASRNSGKIEEIKEVLSKFGIIAISRDEFGIEKFEVEETGSTLEENSFIKAMAIFEIAGIPVIADDSGLEVDALNGRPGVYSARYAGDHCSMQDNRDKMLKELKGVPKDERTARFISVITMIFDNGDKISARGECEGMIAEEERGDKGFGYDPIFIPNGYDITFAEMSQGEKNSISHRGKALNRLEELICEKCK